MKLVHLLASLTCLFAFGLVPALRADDAVAEAKLKELVAHQKTIFAEAEKAGEKLDEENIRGQLQQLGNEYETLIGRNPKFVPAYVAYGLFLGKVDNRKDAIGILLKANALDKNIPVVKNQLGNYLAEEGKPIEAMNYYLSAIQLEPKEALYHLQLGNLIAEARADFMKTGQWTRTDLDKTMQNAFLQAMQCAPDDWRFGYRYGLSFYQVEKPDWDAALQFWKDFEKKLPADTQQGAARINQAKVLLAKGLPEDAKTVLGTVTEPALADEKEKLIAEIGAAAKK
jgi:tetratricopeptide (TPR) repeat protein